MYDLRLYWFSQFNIATLSLSTKRKCPAILEMLVIQIIFIPQIILPEKSG